MYANMFFELNICFFLTKFLLIYPFFTNLGKKRTFA